MYFIEKVLKNEEKKYPHSPAFQSTIKWPPYTFVKAISIGSSFYTDNSTSLHLFLLEPLAFITL